MIFPEIKTFKTIATALRAFDNVIKGKKVYIFPYGNGKIIFKYMEQMIRKEKSCYYRIKCEMVEMKL